MVSSSSFPYTVPNQRFFFFFFAKSLNLRPLLCGKRANEEDVHKIGGTPAVMKYLLKLGWLHGECMTERSSVKISTWQVQRVKSAKRAAFWWWNTEESCLNSSFINFLNGGCWAFDSQSLAQVTGQTLAQNLASTPDLDFGAQAVILPLERQKKTFLGGFAIDDLRMFQRWLLAISRNKSKARHELYHEVLAEVRQPQDFAAWRCGISWTPWASSKSIKHGDHATKMLVYFPFQLQFYFWRVAYCELMLTYDKLRRGNLCPEGAVGKITGKEAQSHESFVGCLCGKKWYCDGCVSCLPNIVLNIHKLHKFETTHLYSTSWSFKRFEFWSNRISSYSQSSPILNPSSTLTPSTEGTSFTGPANVFDGEEAMLRGLEQGKISKAWTKRVGPTFLDVGWRVSLWESFFPTAKESLRVSAN